MSYNGRWAHLTPAIKTWHKQGLQISEIGQKLRDECRQDFDFYTDTALLARYVLRREGLIDSPPKPATAAPEDVCDDVTIKNWLAAQSKHDWPLGVLTRARNIFDIEDSIKTIGDLRSTSDAKLLRIPNFGNIALKAIRDRIGYAPDTTVPSKPPKRPETNEELRKENDFLRGEVEGLRFALMEALRGPHRPKGKSEDKEKT